MSYKKLRVNSRKWTEATKFAGQTEAKLLQPRDYLYLKIKNLKTG